MKFTNLTSNSRSMLAALCASGSAGLDTAHLGRCASPKLDGAQAASVLLDMRKKGLVYSNQKPQGQAYALWKASEFGLAVFQGRPHDVLPSDVVELAGQPSISDLIQQGMESNRKAAPSPDRDRCYIISCPTETLTRNVVGTRDHVLAVAQSLAEANQGKSYVVYEQIATVLLAKPVASITLL